MNPRAELVAPSGLTYRLNGSVLEVQYDGQWVEADQGERRGLRGADAVVRRGGSVSRPSLAGQERAAAPRQWRCDCGAMATDEKCVRGHPAPWLGGGKLVVEPERVQGVVAKRSAEPPTPATRMSMKGIPIDRGIPVPPEAPRARKYPWDEMAAGDSFFVPCEGDVSKRADRGSSIATAGRHWFKRNGVRAVLTSRVVDGGVRVWRIA